MIVASFGVSLLAGACMLVPQEKPQPPAPGGIEIKSGAVEPKVRRFDLKMTVAAPDWHGAQGKARVWLPIPSAGPDQEVVRPDPLPQGFSPSHEPKYGNEMLFLEGAADHLPLPASLTFTVTRHEILRKPRPGTSGSQVSQAVHDDLKRYLAPDRLVPVGGFVSDIAAKIGNGAPPGPAQARAVYDYVLDHMQYKKEGTGWGTGSTKWACDSGYGNCTDFHALFISICRTKQIPARFEIGYPLPEERGAKDLGGYHCWAYFWLDGDGWIPVDISEADKNPKLTEYYFGSLSENRVRLSAERDLVLAPPQQGDPINFFVKPYAEVDGKPQPIEWKLAIVDR